MSAIHKTDLEIQCQVCKLPGVEDAEVVVKGNQAFVQVLTYDLDASEREVIEDQVRSLLAGRGMTGIVEVE